MAAATCISCYSGCTLAPSLLDLLHKVAIQLVSSYDQSDISWHAGKQMSEPKLSCGVSAAHVDRGWTFPLAHVLKRVFWFPPLLVLQITRAQLADFQLLPYIYLMETCREGERQAEGTNGHGHSDHFSLTHIKSVSQAILTLCSADSMMRITYYGSIWIAVGGKWRSDRILFLCLAFFTLCFCSDYDLYPIWSH